MGCGASKDPSASYNGTAGSSSRARGSREESDRSRRLREKKERIDNQKKASQKDNGEEQQKERSTAGSESTAPPNHEKKSHHPVSREDSCDPQRPSIVTSSIANTEVAQEITELEQVRKDSFAVPENEPSAFASFMQHSYRVIRARISHGINADCDQFLDEIAMSVPPLTEKDKRRMEQWLDIHLNAFPLVPFPEHESIVGKLHTLPPKQPSAAEVPPPCGSPVPQSALIAKPQDPEFQSQSLRHASLHSKPLTPGPLPMFELVEAQDGKEKLGTSFEGANCSAMPLFLTQAHGSATSPSHATGGATPAVAGNVSGAATFNSSTVREMLLSRISNSMTEAPAAAAGAMGRSATANPAAPSVQPIADRSHTELPEHSAVNLAVAK